MNFLVCIIYLFQFALSERLRYCSLDLNTVDFVQDFNTVLTDANNLKKVISSASDEPDFIYGNKILDKISIGSVSDYRKEVQKCINGGGEEFLPKSTFDITSVMFQLNANKECLMVRVSPDDSVILLGHMRIEKSLIIDNDPIPSHVLIDGIGDELKYIGVLPRSDIKKNYQSCDSTVFVCEISPGLSIDANLVSDKLTIEENIDSSLEAVKSLFKSKEIDFEIVEDTIYINPVEATKSKRPNSDCIASEISVNINYNTSNNIPKFSTPQNKLFVQGLFKNVSDTLVKYTNVAKKLKRDLTGDLTVSQTFDFIKFFSDFTLEDPCMAYGFTVSAVTLGLILTMVCMCIMSISCSRSYVRNISRGLYRSIRQQDMYRANDMNMRMSRFRY